MGTEEHSRFRLHEAITSLTERELIRLHAWDKLLCAIRRRTGSYGHDDLFQEAITRILNGDRRWPPEDNPDLPFYKFLKETMRSIASSWGKQSYESKAIQDSDTDPESGEAISILETLSSVAPSIERDLLEADLLTLLNSLLPDDETKLVATARFHDGLNGPAIQKQFNITPKRYETISKRIRRLSTVLREILL